MASPDTSSPFVDSFWYPMGPPGYSTCKAVESVLL